MTIIFPYFSCLKPFAICCCLTDKSKYQGMIGSFFSVPTSPNSSIGHSPPALRSCPIGIHTTYNSPDTECYFLSLSLHCLFYLECPLPMMIDLQRNTTREGWRGVESGLKRSLLDRGRHTKKRKLMKGTNQTSIYFGKKKKESSGK